MSAAEDRRRWAYGYLRRVSKPPPAYGTPEFLALPEGPEKWAACVRAAEAWAGDGEDLELKLRIEVEAMQRAYKLAEDTDWNQRREAHEQSWTGTGFRRDPAVDAEVEDEWRAWVNGEAS